MLFCRGRPRNVQDAVPISLREKFSRKILFIIRFPFRSFLSGLHTANLSWQSRVGKPKLVCVNGTKTGGKHICKLLASNRNVFADCFYAVQTHQLEFANTSLPTLVCRVKAALTRLAYHCCPLSASPCMVLLPS